MSSISVCSFADPATEDHGDPVALSDRSIGIKQPLPKVVQCRAAMKDQVIAELDLREEQPMLAARFLSLFRSEEGGEPRQPPTAPTVFDGASSGH
jgi:hypothetical protein